MAPCSSRRRWAPAALTGSGVRFCLPQMSLQTPPNYPCPQRHACLVFCRLRDRVLQYCARKQLALRKPGHTLEILRWCFVLDDLVLVKHTDNARVCTKLRHWDVACVPSGLQVTQHLPERHAAAYALQETLLI
eukprot:3923334-Rhodomonas_salina.2